MRKHSDHELQSYYADWSFERAGGGGGGGGLRGSISSTQIHSTQSLTKNSNVEVLQVFSYLWVDVRTIREVNRNDPNFATVLLLCWGSRRIHGVWMGDERGGVKSEGGGGACKAATNQLTDLVSHYLQFVLRATHDDHIQPSFGQLKMKQSPINSLNSNTMMQYSPPVHSPFLYPQMLQSQLEWEKWNGNTGIRPAMECAHRSQTDNGRTQTDNRMNTWELVWFPDPPRGRVWANDLHFRIAEEFHSVCIISCYE